MGRPTPRCTAVARVRLDLEEAAPEIIAQPGVPLREDNINRPTPRCIEAAGARPDQLAAPEQPVHEPVPLFHHKERVYVRVSARQPEIGEIIYDENNIFFARRLTRTDFGSEKQSMEYCYYISIPAIGEKDWFYAGFVKSKQEVFKNSPYRSITSKMTKTKKTKVIKKKKLSIDNNLRYKNDFQSFIEQRKKFLKEANNEGDNFEKYLHASWNFLTSKENFSDSKVIEWTKDDYKDCLELKFEELIRTNNRPVMPPLKHMPWCYKCAKGKELKNCLECTAAYHEKCTSKDANGKILCPQCIRGFHFNSGDLVWHKLARYPWWPAKIMAPDQRPAKLKAGPSPYHYLVKYFNCGKYRWVVKNETCHFVKDHLKAMNTSWRPSLVLRKAVKDAGVELKNQLDRN